jgi:hypothetical protein
MRATIGSGALLFLRSEAARRSKPDFLHPTGAEARPKSTERTLTQLCDLLASRRGSHPDLAQTGALTLRTGSEAPRLGTGSP